MAVYVKLEYKDFYNNTWVLNISDDDYIGDPIPVNGNVVIRRPKVKVMEVLRGMSLDIKFNVTTADNFYERFLTVVGDKKFPVELLQNGATEFKGFLDVDGITESFVTDSWDIDLKAIDGLGYLKNIEFLQSDGVPYSGPVNELELLARCLELTGQDMNFRLFDIGLIFGSGNDTVPFSANKAILATYVNARRFFGGGQRKKHF